METNAPVFDAARPVAIQLRGPDGTKTVRVRFPSDDECAERQRRRKVIVKNLGRGISETTIPNGEDIDAALLAKIRTEEAARIRSALQAWESYTAGKDRRWLQSLLDSLFPTDLAGA